MAEAIDSKTDKGYKNAVRLVRTEVNYFENAATIDGYKEGDIDQYQYLATLDNRTSNICQGLDLNIFNVKDAMPGTNMPSMHPHCRSTTVPYFADDEPDLSSRIARDKDGKNIHVPADMTYKEWYNIYIKPYKGIDVEIDELTPCLRDAKTGEILETEYGLVKYTDVKDLHKKGWNFNWGKEFNASSAVYALKLKNDTAFQGLVSCTPDTNAGAMFLGLIESAPHNKGKNKKYNGVGGHLAAIIALKSFESNFDGYVYFEAKSKLFEHYEKTLGARRIGSSQRMMIETPSAKKLIEKYFPEVNL